MVNSFRVEKRRVIFLVGEETFFRRVICATKVTGAAPGITWLCCRRIAYLSSSFFEKISRNGRPGR